MKALALILLLALPGAAERRMAITFDDVPCALPCPTLAQAEDVTTRLLEALAAHRAPAVAFVNEAQLQVRGERDRRVGLLERWIAAGHLLGNHTYSHVDSDKVTVAEFQDEVVRGEVVTRALQPGGPTYFRFPYTHTGGQPEKKAALGAFLAARGYVSVPFTIENEDYVFQGAWKTDPARTEAAYDAFTDAVVEFAEKVSRDLFGREIPQILLIHANHLNALKLDAMLGRLRARGYGFVPLEEALRDPAYRTPDEYVGPFGPSWLHRWGGALGKPRPMRGGPEPPTWLSPR